MRARYFINGELFNSVLPGRGVKSQKFNSDDKAIILKKGEAAFLPINPITIHSLCKSSEPVVLNDKLKSLANEIVLHPLTPVRSRLLRLNTWVLLTAEDKVWLDMSAKDNERESAIEDCEKLAQLQEWVPVLILPALAADAPNKCIMYLVTFRGRDFCAIVPGFVNTLLKRLIGMATKYQLKRRQILKTEKELCQKNHSLEKNHEEK